MDIQRLMQVEKIISKSKLYIPFHEATIKQQNSLGLVILNVVLDILLFQGFYHEISTFIDREANDENKKNALFYVQEKEKFLEQLQGQLKEVEERQQALRKGDPLICIN